MSKCYVVSFFLDESSDENLNTGFGSRLIPEIYELMERHEQLLFLVPFGYESSESIMRAVRVAREYRPKAELQCWAVCSCSIEGFYEKAVNEKTKFFDRYVLLKDFADVPSRQGKIMRNKHMVDMSDLSFFYIEKHNGRVHNAMKYAKETGREYIRIH